MIENEDPNAGKHPAEVNDINEVTNQEIPTVQDPETVQKPLYEGVTRSINSIDELTQYTNELERKVIDMSRNVNQYQPTQSVQVPETNAGLMVNGEPIEDALWKHPKEAIQAIVDYTKQGIRKEYQQENESKDRDRVFWEDFYVKNPDLKKFDKQVRKELSSNYGVYEQHAKVDLEKAKRELSTNVRNENKFITEANGSRVEVVNQSTRSLGASSGVTTSAPPQKQAVVSFFDEIKALRKKKA